MNIVDAATKYHWLKIGEDGVPELYLDHHALSTFRMCEAHFAETHLNFYAPKGRAPWGIAFGIVFHKIIEYLYQSKELETFDPNRLFAIASEAWDAADLNYYENSKWQKNFNSLGGKAGFIALIMQYCAFYSGEAERLRPIATEVAFGKAKEVPLGSFNAFEYQTYPVRCYLTGRIDFLMDSGTAIGAMDHKTRAFFKGDVLMDYLPQEGMTGYIFATQAIIKKNFPELAALRKLDRLWLNFILVSNEIDPNKRFKRLPIFKTEWELEEYRLRQLRTFRKIFELVITDQKPDWNTNACSNWFHTECQYRNVHKQGSRDSVFQILNTDFEQRAAWDPEAMDE